MMTMSMGDMMMGMMSGKTYFNIHTGVLGSSPAAAAGISCGDITMGGMMDTMPSMSGM